MFKKGQKVKCINDDYSFVNYGKVYSVWRDSSDNAGNGTCYVIDEDGDEANYCNKDFELFQDVVAAVKEVKYNVAREDNDGIVTVTLEAKFSPAQIAAILTAANV